MADKADSAVGWVLWFRWVLANIVGAVAGLPITVIALRAVAIVAQANEEAIFPYVLFPVVGTCIGGMQWLILKQYTSQTGWWVPATAAAWPASFFFIGLLSRGVVNGGGVFVESMAIRAPVFALIGVLLGGVQWFVLRRHFVRAGWWVLASVVGFIGFAVIGPLTDMLQLVVLLGAFPAVTTGTVLVCLLRQPRLGPSHLKERVT